MLKNISKFELWLAMPAYVKLCPEALSIIEEFGNENSTYLVCEEAGYIRIDSDYVNGEPCLSMLEEAGIEIIYKLPDDCDYDANANLHIQISSR